MSTGSEDSVVGRADSASESDSGRLTGETDPVKTAGVNPTDKVTQLTDLSRRAVSATLGHTLEKDLLSEALRKHYQSVLDEPLPNSLLQLLGALPEQDAEDPL